MTNPPPASQPPSGQDPPYTSQPSPMGQPPARKKKRVRPARKIVPRGNMGIAWIVAPVLIAAIILVTGVWFLLTAGR